MIKPIWLRDEQARVRFRLPDRMASTAPSSMVITPSRKTRSPQGRLWVISRPVMTSMPKMPVLVSMPDNSALAGAGATGWALGSQICTGKEPALAAKPTKIRMAVSMGILPSGADSSP